MKWLQFVIVTVVSISAVIEDPSGNCPSGDPSIRMCIDDKPCLNVSLWCTQLNPLLNRHSYGCCEKSHCKETEMMALNRKYSFAVNWVYQTHNKMTEWYLKDVTVPGGIARGVCPIPYSYQTRHLGDEALPVNFEIGGKPLTQCTKSSDCGPDEFCGHLYNPSFCWNSYLDDEYRNQCLDMSNSGKSVMFCFKSPLWKRQINVKSKKDGIGLAVCSNHSDCQQDFPNESVICEQVEKKMIEVDVENMNNTGKEMSGVCIEVPMCNEDRHKNILGSLGKDGQLCELGKNDTCPNENSECIDVTIDLKYFVLCCELKNNNNSKIDEHVPSARGNSSSTIQISKTGKNETLMIGLFSIVLPAMIIFGIIYGIRMQRRKKMKARKNKWKNKKNSNQSTFHSLSQMD